MSDELWALGSNNQVFTENGKLIATFANKKDAEQTIDDHNLEIELNAPEPPQVIKSREEQRAARLADWKSHDPTGYRLFEFVISGAHRAMNFLSLKAPEFLIARELNNIEEKIWTLKQLHPMPEGFEDVE